MILTERKQPLDEQQIDVQAPIDVPSANTRSRRPVLVVPDKRTFQAAVSEHPISMFMPEPKYFQEFLKQPPETRKLWLKATGSELENLISNDTFQLEQSQPSD
eukprot:11597600-Ditylum_brightwellii.AAC.1